MLPWFLYQGSIVDEIADIVVERLGSAQEVEFGRILLYLCLLLIELKELWENIHTFNWLSDAYA